MKQSVTAVIFNDSGKILAVSRKDNPNDFGLPGGKVDVGETLSYAITREVIEETGLQITSSRSIYSNICNKYYITTAFLIDKWTGFINTDEQGVVKWLDYEKICDPNYSSFAEYNTKLFFYLKENGFM